MLGMFGQTLDYILWVLFLHNDTPSGTPEREEGDVASDLEGCQFLSVASTSLYVVHWEVFGFKL